MQIVLPAIAALGILTVGACAVQRTYETVLNVCSSGNGAVKSANVLKSSGDPVLDQHAVDKVGKSMVYEESKSLSCKPLTVEYRVNGAT
jgi:hypothetical protein